MKRIVIAAIALLAGCATAQTPPKLDGNSLTWLVGTRVHTGANGAKVFEAFIGPQNGVVTGTALAANGGFTEYHKIGPNADGVYGLSVANTRSQLAWNFTPLKSIEADRITFQSADGKRTIAYYAEPGNGVGARVDAVAADGKTTVTEYHFKPLS